MITKLRKKSQITLPKEFTAKLGIQEGDEIEITEKNGVIQIMPVVVYPRKYIEELKKEFLDIKRKIHSGEEIVFEDVDDLFEHLES